MVAGSDPHARTTTEGALPATQFPSFDGFRAVAASIVLVTHVSFSARFNRMTLGEYFARLDVGIAIFFLISGFLLYRPFVVAHFESRSGPGVVPYLWRRVLRIYPAYWAAALVLVYVFGDSSFDTPGDAILHLGLLHIYSPDEVLQGPVLQSWTLCTEVSFYLFLPLFAALLARVVGTVRRRLSLQLVGVATLIVLSAVWKVAVLWLVDDPEDQGWLLTWLPAWLDLFALGMGLAVVSAWLATERRPDPAGLASRWAPWVAWGLAALAFWIVATRIGLPADSIAYSRGSELGRRYLYGAVAFFFLLPGIFGPPRAGLIRKLLQSRVLVWGGLVSYGLYLWHEAWITRYLEWSDAPFGNASFPKMLLFVFVLTAITAVVSYVVIERPALRLKSWGPGRHRAPATATT